MNWKYHNHFHHSICKKKLFQNSMWLFGRMALVNVKTTLTYDVPATVLCMNQVVPIHVAYPPFWQGQSKQLNEQKFVPCLLHLPLKIVLCIYAAILYKYAVDFLNQLINGAVLPADGEHIDLWKQVKNLLELRTSPVQATWVKGHVSQAQVDQVLFTQQDKDGNDAADHAAVAGAAQHAVPFAVIKIFYD